MENNNPSTAQESKGLSFVEQLVLEDLQAGKNGGRLNTRFPPEPNGYLHIGHAKAICMDFGIAEKFGGTCNLRFDDTNPVKEDVEYVDSIREDIHWLGFDWGDREYYASDYFPQLFDLAVRLIKEGKAYVDDQTSEEIAAQKGTPTQPGTESPYRNRSVDWALNFGFGLRFLSHIDINARYGLGLTKAVRAIDDEYGKAGIEGKNRYWTITAAYLF